MIDVTKVKKRLQLAVISAALACTGYQGALAQGSAPFQVAETGRSYPSLQNAVDAIGGGDGTIIIRPGSYADCAVQSQGSISYRASIPGQVIFDGKACEAKAALVLRGTEASVDGLIFQNIAVPDANGAGIRLEKGNLSVTRSIFRNSEQGILDRKSVV